MKYNLKVKRVLPKNAFLKIEASKLSLNEKFLQYLPKTDSQRNLRDSIIVEVAKGCNDFYIPRHLPNFNENQTGICYGRSNNPANGKTFLWWEEAAKNFMPEYKSRLGTVEEYIAFLAVLIKTLVEKNGWSLKSAWTAVCDNSNYLAFPWWKLRLSRVQMAELNIKLSHSQDNSNFYYNTIPDLGFMELNKSPKLLARENGRNVFWMTNGHYTEIESQRALAIMGREEISSDIAKKAFGWVILEK